MVMNINENLEQVRPTVYVEKDGNCLYRAVSCAITGHQYEHLALRLCAIFVLVEYRAFFEKLLAIFDERAYERFVVENAKRGMIDEMRFLLIVTIVVKCFMCTCFD